MGDADPSNKGATLSTVTQYPNWFEVTGRQLFEKHLLPLAGQPGLRFLQIGAFTGDASLWLLDHVLTHPTSTLVDVDTWQGSDEPAHERFDWADVEMVYDARVGDHEQAARLFKWKGTSRAFFADAIGFEDYDFVYIDGDHTPAGVLDDGVAAFRLLKAGGMVAFDDYRWVQPEDGEPRGPGMAVDALAACYGRRLQLVQLGAQAWFRRSA